MRPMRNVEEVGGGNLMGKQRSALGLNVGAIQGFWSEWGIHCLILVSFGLQVFLFLAAGIRRRSVSRVLNSLLWLAYISADSVAIFVLGHLAVHANGSHQLLIFWAPFLLLHLGGQDTITAFSTQDNELWARHLLGLAIQAGVAGYILSISSWPDRWLLAATVVMFLSGFFKYAERTFCLYFSSTERLKSLSLDAYRDIIQSLAVGRKDSNAPTRLKQSIDVMIDNNGNRPSIETLDTLVQLVSDAPCNDKDTVFGADALPGLLRELKPSPYRCRAYDYVASLLVRCYEFFYTKDAFHDILIIALLGKRMPLRARVIAALLLPFPFISTSIALVIFMATKKGQLYKKADVIVSYILLLGAIVLEVASLFKSILSYFASIEAPDSCGLALVASGVANYIHPAGRHRKQWSEMLAQYNLIKSHTRQADVAGIFSSVPQWRIGKHLGYKELTHIPVTQDLKEFVLDKLLDFGIGDQNDWNFASFRGQLALRMYPTLLKINNVDLPTSVLIWHIATDTCYFKDSTVSSNSFQQSKKKRVSRELSNYIMYLVFKCGVMLTSSSKLTHIDTSKVIKGYLKNQDIRDEKRAMDIVTANKDVQYLPAVVENPTACSNPPSMAQLQLLKNNMKALRSPLLPRAFAVAKQLA